MGDFERHRFDDIHSILVEDANGDKLGQIQICAEIKLRESYDHLKPENFAEKPAPPAGPASRRIVSERTGYLIYGHPWGDVSSEVPLPGELDEIVASLKQHEGLRQDEELIPFGHERFNAAFTQWVASKYDYKATFLDR